MNHERLKALRTGLCKLNSTTDVAHLIRQVDAIIAQALPGGWQAQHMREYCTNAGDLVTTYDKDGIDKMLAHLPRTASDAEWQEILTGIRESRAAIEAQAAEIVALKRRLKAERGATLEEVIGTLEAEMSTNCTHWYGLRCAVEVTKNMMEGS